MERDDNTLNPYKILQDREIWRNMIMFNDMISS